MAHIQRNFFKRPLLTCFNVWAKTANICAQPVFALRSLPGVCLDAIPRRFSSSSLPPLFVPGRFAGIFYSTGHTLLAHTGRGV
jgi:hypothetical protein